MTPLTEDETIAHLGRLGLHFDPQYGSRSLTFVRGREDSRFWEPPLHPGRWPHFVDAILTGLDSWAEGYLWPRSGSWLAENRLSSLYERMMYVVQCGAGVPDGWLGAIRLTGDEIDTAIAIACSYMTYAGDLDGDLYFIPGHGRQIVLTSHHDVVHVDCADPGWITGLVQHMTEIGYDLPTVPPDETFKWPAWMPRPSNEPPLES